MRRPRLTRPDPFALGIAGVWTVGAAVFARLGWTVVAGICAGTGLGMLILFWRGDGDDDIEALIRATRETIPDHVPAEWTRRHGGTAPAREEPDQ